ncbi:restriction endonuclease subunit S [Bradyrhizobium icense]|uniref:restriction endonuclease subunit S n=1 Tax=Bradyrhizobium icense TaxID=1274631 RepID=UPI0009F2B45A|nr:restriction endonuclease subunit S [Bradyrhizobium icense]
MNITARVPPIVGWKRFTLGEVLTLVNGRAYKQDELLENGTPVVRIQNLNGGSNWYYSDLNLPDDKYCENGDLLFAWSATFGPYFWSGCRAIYHYHIWKVLPSPLLDKKYAFYLLQNITEKVKASGRGISMIHVTKSGMEAWEVDSGPEKLFDEERVAKLVTRIRAINDSAVA